jgi:hypothetical protein
MITRYLFQRQSIFSLAQKLTSAVFMNTYTDPFLACTTSHVPHLVSQRVFRTNLLNFTLSLGPLKPIILS